METPDWIQLLNLERWRLVVSALVVSLVLLRLLKRFFDDLTVRFKGRRMLFNKLAVTLRFLVWLTLTVFSLSVLIDFNQMTLYAVTGTVVLALGIAFKDVLTSVTGGLLLLAEAPFQVGDRIAFGGYYGEVQKIGLRSVQIVTLDDNLVTIPSARFLTESVASANAGALDCMVVIPFYLAAAEDFETARRLVLEATVTSRYVFLEKGVVTLVSDEFLGERFVTVIRVKAYVFDIHYEKAFASDVTERVKKAFAEAGLRTPDQQYRDLDLNQGREVPR